MNRKTNPLYKAISERYDDIAAKKEHYGELLRNFKSRDNLKDIVYSDGRYEISFIDGTAFVVSEIDCNMRLSDYSDFIHINNDTLCFVRKLYKALKSFKKAKTRYYNLLSELVW